MGSQIRTGYVKMMDDDEKEAELAKYNDEVAKAAKQGKPKKRRKLDYPQCHTCQADMLRPFICLECAFTACFSPPHRRRSDRANTHPADSHMIQHLRSKKHAFAFDLLYGHVYCAECRDFIHDPVLESIRRHETCRVNHKVVGQQFGPVKTTVESLFPASSDTPLSKFYETDTATTTCRVPRGLRNMGATCYMNVIIQAFLHNPLLRNYFLSDRHNPSLCTGGSTCLACEMDKIFVEFYSSDPGAVAPSVQLRVLSTVQQRTAMRWLEDRMDLPRSSTACGSIRRAASSARLDSTMRTSSSSRLSTPSTPHSLVGRLNGPPTFLRVRTE